MNYYTERRGANHGLHLVLTVLTCGLWAITGWPIAAIMGRKRTYRGPAQPMYQQYYLPGQQPPPGPQPPPYPPQGYGPPPPNPYQQPPGPYGPPPRP